VHTRTIRFLHIDSSRCFDPSSSVASTRSLLLSRWTMILACRRHSHTFRSLARAHPQEQCLRRRSGHRPQPTIPLRATGEQMC
jgi:hypothetical protein